MQLTPSPSFYLKTLAPLHFFSCRPHPNISPVSFFLVHIHHPLTNPSLRLSSLSRIR
ncbi:hypothetical protein Hanom_Chr08g00747391 [Helianthus anomalus]